MTDPLDVLIADGVIDDVLGRLKSGKEADISLVRRGADVIAAKVYKDRATRSFKNNSDYKEGRKVRNTRTQRAMDSGGRFGRDAAEQAWKSAEANALYKLAGSGVRVPEPVMFYEGVLLMQLVQDAEGRPAPRLIDVAIQRDAAMGVYADLVAQMIAMLCCDLIHGDLSPYNILAAADGPTIIDFPQVVSAAHSSRAEYFFLRDFDNVLRFLSDFDPSLAVHSADGRAIWRAYVSRDLTPQFVPPPPRPQPIRPPRAPDSRSRPDVRGRGRPPHNRDNRPQQQPRAAQQQQPRAAQQQQRLAQQQQRPAQQQQRPAQQQQQRPAQQQQPRAAQQQQPRGAQQQQPRGAQQQPRPAQQQPRAAQQPYRPAPPAFAQLAANGSSNSGPPRGGRRRPKRRW